MADWQLPPKNTISFKILYLYLVEQKTIKEISAEMKLSKHQIKKIIKELPPITRPDTMTYDSNMDEKIKQKF